MGMKVKWGIFLASFPGPHHFRLHDFPLCNRKSRGPGNEARIFPELPLSPILRLSLTIHSHLRYGEEKKITYCMHQRAGGFLASFPGHAVWERGWMIPYCKAQKPQESERCNIKLLLLPTGLFSRGSKLHPPPPPPSLPPYPCWRHLCRQQSAGLFFPWSRQS